MLTQFLNNIFKIKQTLWLLPYKIYSKISISNHLKLNTESVKLNIGCGGNLLPGWLNGEPWPSKGTVYIDASRKLPFKQNSVHFINCEHLLEHLDFNACRSFLNNCSKVLDQKGVLRIATPNLGKLIDIYLKNRNIYPEKILEHHAKYHNRSAENICQWFNDHMYLWGHKFIFDKPTLIKLLRESGFQHITECEYGKSEHRELEGIEMHDENAAWIKKGYVMIFEAKK